MRNFHFLFIIASLLSCLFITDPIFCASSLTSTPMTRKALICGVCKNVGFAVDNTIRNIEKLGKKFDDYAVIIYENNSSDNTVDLFSKWAKENPHVVFISEILSEPPHVSREEKIARARNIVLELARDSKYNDFEHLIMVDLDFITPWPIREIVETTKMPGQWDCITANGLFSNGSLYWDRYAFRNESFPLGPEVIGQFFWDRLFAHNNWFQITQKDLLPVYSAFGGLGIYKRESIINFSY
jgi:hypothetical protein